MTRFRLFAEWSVLLFASAILVILAHARAWVEPADLRMLDITNNLIQSESSDEIVIVAIDDRSLSELGNWPWSRGRHAELIAKLTASQPSVIGMDILFLEPTDPEQDSALAETVGQAGNVVVPHSFLRKDNSLNETVVAFPIEPLLDNAAAIGHVAVYPDSDGIVRRFIPNYVVDNQEFQHLSLALAKRHGLSDRVADLADEEMIFPAKPSGHFPTVSAADVLMETVPPEFFKDKIILVGSTALGLGDRYSVPTEAGRIMPGVEIQANILDSVITDNLIDVAPTIWVLPAHLLAILSLFLVYWLSPPNFSLRYSVYLILALLLTSFVGIWLFKTAISVTPALLAILVAYPLWGWRRLESVSRFLEGEALALRSSGGIYDDERELLAENEEAGGFDFIERQVLSLKGLTGEVRERLEFIQNIVDASPDPIMVFDGDGKLAMFNANADELFLQDQDSNDQTFEELVSLRQGEIDTAKREIRIGDDQTFLFASAQLDRQLGSRIVALRDISSIKMIERQRRETLEFLSHDMRSPQVAIIGLVGRSGTSLEAKDRLYRIEVQARRTLQLADNFVQIARLENDGIRAEEIEVGALVYEAADRAYALARRKNITIECDVPKEPIFYHADGSAISRMIDNLLSNAMKFSPAETRIWLELTELSTNRIMLVVEDEGPGIPAERMLDPFKRFGAHETEAGPSAGLGLAFVKRAVEEHGGTIRVMTGLKRLEQRKKDPSTNPGARFEIEFPLA